MKSLNPIYAAYRGRAFHRISPNNVETFHLVSCSDCKCALSANHITMFEQTDQNLLDHGLNPMDPPERAVSIGSDYYCHDCSSWLLDHAGVQHVRAS